MEFYQFQTDELLQDRVVNFKEPLILIIDDEIDFANTISAILQTKGYTPIIATSGWEALNLLKQVTPDVALVDLKLPDTDGIHLLGEIKKYAPGIEAIILTGYASLDSALQALQIGASSYLKKPCPADRLFLAIENALIHQRNTISSPSAFGELFFNSPLPIVIFDPNSGAIIGSNKSFLRWTEQSDSPAAAKNLIFLFAYEEKALTRYLEDLKINRMADGKIKGPASPGEERHYRIISFLDSNDPNRATGILLDITRDFNSHLELRRTAEYFQNIWQNLATGIAIVDSQFTFLEVNPYFAQLYETDPEQFKGKKCHSVLHGFSRPCYHYGETCPIAHTLASGTAFRTAHMHHIHGRERYIELTVAPLHDENGAVSAFLVIHNDLTEIKLAHEKLKNKSRELSELNEQLKTQAEELKKTNFELIRASSSKDEFISTVSHELRTPLTVIAEALNLLIDGSLGPLEEKQLKFLNTAVRNCTRLTGLINDLLDLSKLETDKMQVRPTTFDLAALIRDVRESLYPAALEKQLRLEVKMPEPTLSVYADESHIHRVLLNLVGNAIKFTDEGGIEITATRHNEKEVLVVVRDTGIGIPESEQKNIFERFYQAHHPGGLRPPGTGLGLAIVKRLLELNGGRIWLESKPNCGSRFFFTVPAASAVDTRIASGDTENGESTCDGKRN